jgi:peptidoglycan/xylan/chitin deacetylase (PgdA/CDA1 family)
MIDIDFYLSKLSKNMLPIFLFHGVVKDANTGIRNYTKKHLYAEEFELLIKKLKLKGTSISMDDLMWHGENGRQLPPYSYAITFDDGFENNYSVAAPILERYSTSATFYISTNLVNNNLMTWTDQIEYCLNNISQALVELPWNKNCYQLNSEESIIDCLKDIRFHLKKQPQIYKYEKIVDMIFDQCGMKIVSSSNHPLDKKMNWDQVSELHHNKLFTVGGHSHNHVSLGLVESSVMKNEIDTSIKLLKEKANISSHHYSYPEGQRHDFNENVIEKLKSKDIKCCPSAIDGLNELTIGSMFHLQRVMVD